MLGIYVHIPFCKSKCRYCDFNSSDKYFGLEDTYTKALISEIENSPFCETADTFFFGGGTPTAMRLDNLTAVIDAAKRKFGTNYTEFTVECNPATIGYEGFLTLKESGVNRISIGLQSANNDELAVLGRIHTREMFLKTYEDAKRAGFENINIDLMFSLHEQTPEKWLYTLNYAIDLNPAHISCYSLIIEEGTPFFNENLKLPDEETDRRMYYDAVDLLEKRGYIQYEISNFAKKGFECAHNIKYWRRENYLGFGCGASGLYNNVRYCNSYDICEYISENKPEKTILTNDEAKSEHIFLGLRMTDGFDVEQFNRMYNADFVSQYGEILDKYKKLGLLECEKRCRLTKKGISVSNSVMCEFV